MSTREAPEPGTSGRTRVAVVFGGRSTEHAVSCVSAGSILGAIDTERFEIVPVGISRDGDWVLTTGARPALDGARRTDLVPAGGDVAVVDARAGVAELAGVDVVFPVLHGAFGAEGAIQGLLEMADLPYVGSGLFASSAALDRHFTRKLAAAAGLSVVPHAVLREGQELGHAERARLGLPVLVRPARPVGAAGATVVADWSELPAALAAAREVDVKVVVDARPAGRRMALGVLDGEDGGPPQASVPAEVHGGGDGGHLDDVAEFTVPAEVPHDVETALRHLALAAFEALDCAGLARVDVVVTAGGEIYLDEVNTMPGFTPEALFPRVWAASGVRYQSLITRLIAAAVRRGTGLH